ncbi:monocarboxylate transporter 13-like [Leptidea sinapis]|uniref:monocarboxylate transporter 13-like n=1 Tax=Leptidea sinapis TaxID=189913 RepID=UPI0021C4BF76|nr:monocarboxylate transporter 13-like [Leptidea sinapis]
MDEAYAHMKISPQRQGKSLSPPDGGWGYLVCIGVGFTFMLGFGSSNAFGILFHDFFLEQDGASGVPLVIGVYNGALSIAGFLSGIALKKYSFRQVGLVGAGLFVLGDVLTIFVQRTYQLVFTFGVIRGAGFGVMIPVSFTAFNCYFTKKRTAMMSANQTMSSMASITFPLLVTVLLAEYGFKWTLALIMAVDLHLLFAMMVMHPVEWHMIKDPQAADMKVCSKHTSTAELSLHCDVIDTFKSDIIDEAIIKMLPGDEIIEIKPTQNRHESLQKSIM